jgi:hypothetical protein
VEFEPVRCDTPELSEQRLEVDRIRFDPERVGERLGVPGVMRAQLRGGLDESVHPLGAECLDGERCGDRRVEPAAQVDHDPGRVGGPDRLAEERLGSFARPRRVDPSRAVRLSVRVAIRLRAVSRRRVHVESASRLRRLRCSVGIV